MMPATVTLKGVWALVVAAAFGLLLIALGVQTVRLEGFTLWPVTAEGWKPKAERLQTDLDNIKRAQKIALQQALAANAATAKASGAEPDVTLKPGETAQAEPEGEN